MHDIDTGGGALVKGNVNTGNDFVGRDKLIAETINSFHNIVFEGIEKPNRYQEEQFKAYVQVWKSLQLLRFCADDIWERLTLRDFLEYIEQLRCTTIEVRQNQIFFEKEDFRQLTLVLRKFTEFSIGKYELLKIYGTDPVKFGEDRFETIDIDNKTFSFKVESYYDPYNTKEVSVSDVEAVMLMEQAVVINHRTRARFEQLLDKICMSFRARLKQASQ